MTGRLAPGTRRPRAFVRLAAAAVVLIAGSPAHPAARAAEPRPAIAGLAVDRSPDGSSRIRFQAGALFDQQGRDAIESGVTATVVVTWEIDHPRTLWLDETLERQQQIRTLAYDNVTKRYRVDIDSGSAGHYETSSFDEAERRLGSVEAVIRSDLGSPGEKLVRVRLSCDSRDGMLPLGLEKVLFFLPGWGFDTGWVSLAVP